MPYFNNHNHTEYSNALLGFPDIINRVPNLIQRAYDLGLSGITITEHEGVSSHIQAIKYLEEARKPQKKDGKEYPPLITRPFTLALGNEIYLMDEWEDEENRNDEAKHQYYHFILTALDTEGHKQIRELSTRAWLRAYKKSIWRRPTYYADLEEIVKPNQGHVIASTACLGSRIDQLLLNYKDINPALDEYNRLVKIFGEGNLYLEIQPPKEKDCDQSIVNKRMWELHKATGCKIIPTTDSHYLCKEDAYIHSIYLKSQEGDREVDDFYATAYLMSADELREHLSIDFNDAQINQMFEWSEEIGRRIKGYDIRHNPIIPQIPLDKIPAFEIKHLFKNYYSTYENFGWYAYRDVTHERYFFSQIEQALQSKIIDKGKDLKKYIARLDEEWKELRIISEQLDTSMPSYYSTMSAIIDLIWEAGSLAMPARGSAAGFLTCYLLEVTQIDPVPLGDYMPSWRHLNHERGVELPDIDNDSEASKKKAIVNKMKEFFGEDKVLNVATFSKISSKTALERACSGLGINNDTAAYLKSLIPVNRGKTAKLKDCVFGNKEKGIKPVYELVNELKKYPNVQEVALALEGLITNRGTHAAGVIVCNEPYTEYIAAMRSADGTLETCYDLWDAEEAGCIKFDMLTVAAADKIHKTMDYLLEHNKITWEGSLKATYYKWIHPDVLNYTDPKMWAILPSIYSVFQFDTPISSKALGATKPQSAMDLSAANSLLRLMPDNADETPIDRYQRYKQSHQAWLDDVEEFGLNESERDCLWEYLSDAYGLADSQEKIMRLSMDKRVSGYSLNEANKLRKSIAKKDEKLQAEAKAMFFKYGRKLGTREVFLDYIWNVVFAASMGYSFSQLHSYSYSIIALQELNLNYFYPRVYWNCACLSIEAAGITDDNDGSNKTNSTDYGEVAKAIYKMKQSGVEVSPPSINESDIDFTPVEEKGEILFGVAGIAGINQDISNQILTHRPYTSFKQFYQTHAYKGSLITPSKFIQLIKSGCFDDFEPNRVKVMKQYILYSSEPKTELTMANLDMTIKIGCKIPKQMLSPYNFRKYVCSSSFFYGVHPKFKSKKLYWLDDKAQKYFNKNCKDQLQENVDWFYQDDMVLIVDKSLEKLYKPVMTELKAYINTPEFIEEFNRQVMRKRYNELVPNQDVNHWSFETCSFFAKEHELAHIDRERYNIDLFDELPEEPRFVTKRWGKREWKQYELAQIAAVVLDRNDNNHLLTVLDMNNNVVQCKFDANAYSFYKQQISEPDGQGGKTVVDPSWFKRGQGLILTGVKMGENDFRVKAYKSSIYRHKVQKIVSVDNDTGEMEIQSYRYGYEPDE